MTGFTVRAALFLLLFNVVMLFIVPFRTAEWYVTVFSVILMTVLLAVIRIGAAVTVFTLGGSTTPASTAPAPT